MIGTIWNTDKLFVREQDNGRLFMQVNRLGDYLSVDPDEFAEFVEHWNEVKSKREEIAACPVCGETQEPTVGVRYGSKYGEHWWVTCHDCQIKSFSKPTKPEAIEAWNNLPRKEE